MAQNFRINMKRWNGTDYDTLLPMNGASNPVIGDIMLTTGNPPDDTWALCNGDEIDPAEYPVLAGIIQENLDLPVGKTVGKTSHTQRMVGNGNRLVAIGNSGSYGDHFINVSTNGGTTFTKTKINNLDTSWFHVNFINSKWVFFGIAGSKLQIASSTDLANFTIYNTSISLNGEGIVPSASSVYFKGKYFILFRQSRSMNPDIMHLLSSSDLITWTENIESSLSSPNTHNTNLCITPDGTCMGFVAKHEAGSTADVNWHVYLATTDGNNFSSTMLSVIPWQSYLNSLLLLNGSTATSANCLVGVNYSDNYYTYFLKNNAKITADGKALSFTDYKYVDDNIVYTFGDTVNKFIIYSNGAFSRVASDISGLPSGAKDFTISDKIYGHLRTGDGTVFIIPKALPMIANSNYFAYIKTNF